MTSLDHYIHYYARDAVLSFQYFKRKCCLKTTWRATGTAEIYIFI
jgi:hypothetical protein